MQRYLTKIIKMREKEKRECYFTVANQRGFGTIKAAQMSFIILWEFYFIFLAGQGKGKEKQW